MARIIGIDPGSLITGYGIVEIEGNRSRHLDHGCIRTPTDASIADRLKCIFDGVGEVIAIYQPEEMAIEQVFMNKNADAALKLGQARGVAICAAAHAGIAVSEYAPRSIKQAVVGKGGASKEQVQHMVCALLGLQEKPQADAADGLAVAICHGHTMATSARMGIATALLARRR